MSISSTIKNICVILWRVFTTVEGIHYCRGDSVLWRISFTVEDVLYCAGCSVLWGEGETISTAEGYYQCCKENHQYFGGCLALRKDTINTIEDVQ